MKEETRVSHYAEFLLIGDGELYPVVKIRPARDRDNRPPIIPKDSYAYRFFDVRQITLEDGEILFGIPRNYSGWNYINGELIERRRLREMFPGKKFGRKRIVMTRAGFPAPLESRDNIVLGEIRYKGFNQETFK